MLQREHARSSSASPLWPLLAAPAPAGLLGARQGLDSPRATSLHPAGPLHCKFLPQKPLPEAPEPLCEGGEGFGLTLSCSWRLRASPHPYPSATCEPPAGLRLSWSSRDAHALGGTTEPLFPPASPTRKDREKDPGVEAGRGTQGIRLPHPPQGARQQGKALRKGRQGLCGFRAAWVRTDWRPGDRGAPHLAPSWPHLPFTPLPGLLAACRGERGCVGRCRGAMAWGDAVARSLPPQLSAAGVSLRPAPAASPPSIPQLHAPTRSWRSCAAPAMAAGGSRWHSCLGVIVSRQGQRMQQFQQAEDILLTLLEHVHGAEPRFLVDYCRNLEAFEFTLRASEDAVRVEVPLHLNGDALRVWPCQPGNLGTCHLEVPSIVTGVEDWTNAGDMERGSGTVRHLAPGKVLQHLKELLVSAIVHCQRRFLLQPALFCHSGLAWVPAVPAPLAQPRAPRQQCISFPKTTPAGFGDGIRRGTTAKPQHWRGMTRAGWDEPAGIAVHTQFSLRDRLR
ncbi:hypothetical protein LUU34_00913900 [Aix galericulata]|nr:hypothetical protein LUU34_00913900 [Aix galericulata]